MKIKTIYIIHQYECKSRMKYILDIQRKYPLSNIVIVEPDELSDDTSSLICRWNKNYPQRKREISLYTTNIRILRHVVQMKQNNVLILEDDAIQIEDIGDLDPNKWIHYLNTRWYLGNSVKRCTSCQANLYINWYNTERLLNNLLLYCNVKKNRFRPIDYELDYMKTKYNLEEHYEYHNLFHHDDENPSTIRNLTESL